MQLLLGSGSPVGPAHIVDCEVTGTTDAVASVSHTTAAQPFGAASTPSAANIAAWDTLSSGGGGGNAGAVFAVQRAVDFVIAGFPKTGTSSLWFNLGTITRVSMYSTEPADWREIVRWRRSSSFLSSSTTIKMITPTLPLSSSANAETRAGEEEAEALREGSGGAWGQISAAEEDKTRTTAEAGAVGKGVENAGNYKSKGSLLSASLFSPLLRTNLEMAEREEKLVGFKCTKAIYDSRWIFAT